MYVAGVRAWLTCFLDTITEIKAAMQNIPLPAQAMENWVFAIPDDEWSNYVETVLQKR